MVAPKAPRKGSLQYWPRKRGAKFLPSVNWDVIPSNNTKHLKGFIAYKTGMVSVEIKDSTPDSMTKDKKIIIPATILECPPMRIFSVRFYKYSKVAREVLAENPDKELKRKITFPKKFSHKLESVKPEEYDDIRVIVYSQVKKTKIKKTPDMSEIALTGANVSEKLAWVKEHLGKEISIADVFENNSLMDSRGLTKGKGFQGPVKRFGVKLRFHKTEKGQRKVGSIGPWHPTGVTFRVPQSGQMGMYTRLKYNNKIISVLKSSEKPVTNLKNYGNINTDYIVVDGSVQGSAKRPLLITAPLRATKKQAKKKFELLRIIQ